MVMLPWVMATEFPAGPGQPLVTLAPHFGGDKDALGMKCLLGRAGGAQERRQSDLKSCCKVEGNDLFSMNRINGFKVKEGEPLTITNEVRAAMNCLGRLWGLGQEGV